MRQGGGGSEDVEIVLTNVGSAACRLPHIPARIELLTRDGHPLPLDTRPPVGSPGPDVELAPGDAPSGDLVAYWSNWCGASPGPLSARITFRPGLQLTVPLSQGGGVPECIYPSQRSWIVIDSLNGV
jgi:hypothetical protein